MYILNDNQVKYPFFRLKGAVKKVLKMLPGTNQSRFIKATKVLIRKYVYLTLEPNVPSFPGESKYFTCFTDIPGNVSYIHTPSQ